MLRNQSTGEILSWDTRNCLVGQIHLQAAKLMPEGSAAQQVPKKLLLVKQGGEGN